MWTCSGHDRNVNRELAGDTPAMVVAVYERFLRVYLYKSTTAHERVGRKSQESLFHFFFLGKKEGKTCGIAKNSNMNTLRQLVLRGKG
jgi:hypothetical protein